MKFSVNRAHLENKRVQVLETIKPICEAFGIKDYDYIVQETVPTEVLRIYDTRISCASNSIQAIRDELVGYILINTFCRNRSLGSFSTQTKNVIKRYWIKEDE